MMGDANYISRNNPIIDHTTTTATTTTTSTSTTAMTTTTKPKLSLLSSSKQYGTNRVESVEDQPDHKITILSSSNSSPDDYVSSNCQEEQQPRRDLLDSTTTHPLQTSKFSSDAINGKNKESHQDAQPINNAQQHDQENKMNITKEDLIRLLSMLKSELQSKEFALAAIKCEQVKRLINPVEISRSSLANTYIELQDRFKIYDQNNNKKTAPNKSNDSQITSSASTVANQNSLIKGFTLNNLQNSDNDIDEENERESLNILNTLLELLDRHPLLALPRDSIYCLDYNCNELSTKNYLNLKIQHLDNLINQHKSFRFYMNERLKRSEQRYIDLTRELEMERKLKFENEKELYKATGKGVLLKNIEQLKEALEKEKKDKQAIVMTLLNELLDERERNETLTKKIADNEKAAEKLNQKNNSVEKERLKVLETELNNLSLQLKKQITIFAKEKTELQTKTSELEVDNLNLKTKLEQQEKRIAALLSKSSSTASTPDHTRESTPSSRSTTTAQRQSNPPNKQFSNAPAVVTRTSLGSSTSTKSTPSNKTSTTNSSSSTGHNSRGLTSSISSNGGSAPNRQSIASSSQSQTSTPNSSKPSAPPLMSRLLGGGSSSMEHATVRVQPLFKSASVASSNQQAKNNKSQSSASGGSCLNRASSVSSSNQSPPVTSKPQVPAKPAQLLDQQRSPLS